MAFNTKNIKKLYDRLNNIVSPIAKEELIALHAEIIKAETELEAHSGNNNVFTCSLKAREDINALVISYDLQQGTFGEKKKFTSLRVKAIQSTKDFYDLVDRIITAKGLK